MKKRLLPPTFLNALLLLGIVLHFVLPIKRIIHPPYSYGGILFIVFAVILNIWSGSTLRMRNTTIDFHKAANQLVTDGPFRISRNPIYLSGVILSLGVAMTLGTLVMFILPVGFFVILDRFYIPLEENRLEKAFGQKYLEYKRRIRRWI